MRSSVILLLIIYSLRAYSGGEVLCPGYESIILRERPITANTDVVVEICCNRHNTDYQDSDSDYVVDVQLELKKGDAIQIYNKNENTSLPLTFLCSEGVWCRSFVSASITKNLPTGISLRVYHRELKEGERLMNVNGSPSYYGFRVIQGAVSLVDSENKKKICDAEAQTESGSIEAAGSKIRKSD